MPKSAVVVSRVVLLFALLFLPLSFVWAQGKIAVTEDGAGSGTEGVSARRLGGEAAHRGAGT
jgi:hypothetical protein